MAAINFVPGSIKSIRFLKALQEKAVELNQLFTSKAIRRILTYKFSKVKGLGYCLATSYCAYLGFLIFYPKKWIMTLWFTF
jgi:hypothetical protein